MSNWFINLLIAIGMCVLTIWIDVNTNLINYNFGKVELLVVTFLMWIVLNQFDILRELKDKEKKK